MSVDCQHSWRNTNTTSPSSSLLRFPKLTPSNIAVCSGASPAPHGPKPGAGFGPSLPSLLLLDGDQ